MQQYYEIPTPKGVLRGFLHQPACKEFPICIIFHGFTGQKTGTKFSYVQLARMLESKNIGTLRMDFLGSGESDLAFKDMTFGEELSCAKVIVEEVLSMEVAKEVYVLGHSMGGAVASEIAKLYRGDIKKMCLWAPAFNLPEAIDYLIGKIPANQEGLYDHGGYEISQDFVEDIVKRDFYKGLDTYKNDVFIIHGTKDATVPYDIHEKYQKGFGNQLLFTSIPNGNHNFDTIEDIKKVLKLTLEFFVGNNDKD